MANIEWQTGIFSCDQAYIAAQQALYPAGQAISEWGARDETGFPLVGVDTFSLDTPPYIKPIDGFPGGAWFGILAAAGVYGRAIVAAPYDTGGPTITVEALWFCLARASGNNVNSGTAVLMRSDTAQVLSAADPNIKWGYADHTPPTYTFRSYYLVQGGCGAVVPGHENIRQRRWIEGWEIPLWDSGSGGSLVTNVTRQASRTPEGFGLSLRDRLQIYTRTVNTHLAGNHRGSWERIYFRMRTFPTGAVQIWRCFNSANPATSGVQINITPAGDLEVYNVNSASVFTLIGTAPGFFALRAWVRLDVVFSFNSGADDAYFKLFRNGIEIFSATVSAASGGLGLAGFHATTQLGNLSATGGIELDIDDWINAEPPVAFNGIDWLNGSHVMLLRPASFDASHSVNWTGDWRTLMNNPGIEATEALSSTTSGARLAVVADADERDTQGWFQEGVAAFAVAILSSNSGGTDGQLGYSIAGGADVLVTIDELISMQNRGMMYNPSGMSTPNPILPLVLLHTKSADGNTGLVRMLMAAAEGLGVFGEPDIGTGMAPVQESIHNAPFANPTGAPTLTGFTNAGQVSTEGGVYVGNGLGQDVQLYQPPHWIYIRPLTPASGMPFWFSTMIGTHRAFGIFDIAPHLMPQALFDGTNYLMRVAGGDAMNNFSGRSYQYIAVSDRAARFLLNGALQRPNGLGAGINGLDNNLFFPEAAFFQIEHPQVTGVTLGAYYKGKGHAAANASLLTGAEVGNAMSFGLGSLVSQQPPFHPTDESVAYSAWRVFDGPGDGGPAVNSCDPSNPDPGRLFAVTFYTGNGSSPRNISLQLNGHRPLLAIVVPHNGSAYVRDPSHTGSDSSRWDNGSIDTAAIISGGVDFIQVGATLNSNGIVYDVFVLAGDNGGSGWGTNSYHIPVGPAQPCNPVPPSPPPPPPPGPGSACASGDFPTELT